MDSASDVAAALESAASSDPFENKKENKNINLAHLMTMQENLPYFMFIVSGILITVICVPFIIYKVLKKEKLNNTETNLDNVVNDDSNANKVDNVTNVDKTDVVPIDMPMPQAIIAIDDTDGVIVTKDDIDGTNVDDNKGEDI